MSFAETSLTIREPQPRTSSTQRTRGDRRDLKRRLSLDIRAFVRIPEPPVPSPALSDTVKYGDIPAMDGRRSAGREGSAPHMTRPYDTTEPEEGVPVPDVAPPAVEGDSALVSDLDSDSEDGARPLSLEKQRLLNVRRARKMLQVFGNEPPPALFQITNIPANATDEGISVALSIAHRRDDSRATATSVPSSTLSVPDTRHGQRDSVGTASSADNLSPLVFADPASVPPSRVHSPHQRPADGDPELIPPLPPLPPSQDTVLEIAPSSPLSVPTVASSSLHSLSAPSAISIPASHSYSTLDQGPLSSPIRSSFQASPPANQTMFLWGPASAPASPPLATASVLSDPLVEVHPADPHFRDRRRRAAKLSRFFGVGLHDIAGMLRGGSSSSAGAAATTGTPASPPLREFKRSGSSDSIPSPVSPQETVPSPTSVRSSRSTRPATSSGIVGDPSVSIAESPRPRKRTLSSGTRSQSVSGRPRRPQTQPSMQPGVERNRSNSQPEGMSQQMHNRAFSTTVEVLAESKGRFAFLDTRRPSKVKELNMQDVVRELRKIK
ncbi:hypothetical protein BV20DRAFT_961380 [Pilatotrama ljubarskyi]|nr:hypothetical protein BV20DRAFT_961380 [Pilatotrama ljubarskyi]